MASKRPFKQVEATTNNSGHIGTAIHEQTNNGIAYFGQTNINNHYGTPRRSPYEEELAQRERLEEKRKQYIDSLDFPSLEARAQNIKDALTHTCSWILQLPEYCQWSGSGVATEASKSRFL
ncbi:hypothetical protein B9Z65_7766 [Elsinoe australis]|uniref:Uncharacterized protein n=1 Tax=Elsinoe australis TaxID=40998 RepID=A0A2P8A0H2_9PEZI|nr:hypothetical protein B9Z65_7766 [Elsinoe australis]